MDLSDLPVEIQARLEKNAAGCWIWTGAKAGKPGYQYGLCNRPGATQAAHRYTYELLVGPIGKALQIHRSCGHSLCCNPSHAEVMSKGEMLKRYKRDPGKRPRDETHKPLQSWLSSW